MTDNKMTAEDLAEYLLDWSVVKDSPFAQVIGGKAAQMLRRQHEAIKMLREALGELTTAGEEAWGTERPCVWIGLEALKDTEGL